MPTYEYLCPEGHTFDVFQKMSDKPRAKCPKCGRMATRQISGGAGLVFKGSGFYITDYGKDGKGPRKEPVAPSSDSSASSSSGEKSGTEKSGTEKSTTEKASTAASPEKPAEKNPKAKSSSKKAKE
jgi:putative FmdB family regulatory protein